MEVYSQNSQHPCYAVQKPLMLPLRLMVKLSEENSLLPLVSKVCSVSMTKARGNKV